MSLVMLVIGDGNHTRGSLSNSDLNVIAGKLPTIIAEQLPDENSDVKFQPEHVTVCLAPHEPWVQRSKKDLTIILLAGPSITQEKLQKIASGINSFFPAGKRGVVEDVVGHGGAIDFGSV